MTDSEPTKPRGFAALDTLVSDVSQDVARAERTAASSPRPTPTETQPALAAIDDKNPASRSAGSALMWAILAMVLAGIFINMVLSPNQQASRSSPPSTVAATEPPSVPAPAPAPATARRTSPKPADIPAPKPAVQPAYDPQPTYANEQKPPQGSGMRLSIPEIRWCRRESIQLQAIEAIINNSRKRDVDRFNARVDDYNLRCSNFQYRRGDLEIVDSRLALERSALEQEARLAWAGKAPVQREASIPFASATDSDECKRGFRRIGRACERVEIPSNGRLDSSGHDWECKPNYRPEGFECVRR